MKALNAEGARHFVSSFSNSTASSGCSVRGYLNNSFQGGVTLKEGSAEFSGLRDCLLRDSERSMVLAASNFARALDGLRASSGYWTLVGLYYAAFFSARAIMGIHGCWMSRRNRWLEATKSNPHHQELTYRKKNYSVPGSSHEVTWAAYYAMAKHLEPFVPSELALAVEPIDDKRDWMTSVRNRVNYDPVESFRLMEEFRSGFDRESIPSCFPYELRTAVKIARSMIELSQFEANRTGLKTDAVAPDRAAMVRSEVTCPNDAAVQSFSASLYPVLER